MAKDDREFRHESLQDGRSLTAYMEAIKAGFINGTLTLKDDTGEIVVHPSGLIRLQIDTTRKRDRVKMVLRLEWKEEEASGVQSNGALVIDGNPDE